MRRPKTKKWIRFLVGAVLATLHAGDCSAEERMLIHVLDGGVQTTLGYSGGQMVLREDREIATGAPSSPASAPLLAPDRVIWMVASGRKTRVGYSGGQEVSRQTWDTSSGKTLGPDLHLTLPPGLSSGSVPARARPEPEGYMPPVPRDDLFAEVGAATPVEGSGDLFGDSGSGAASPYGDSGGFVGEAVSAVDLFGEDLGGVIPAAQEKPRGLDFHGTVETLLMFGEDGPSPHVFDTGLSGNRAIEARNGILHLSASLGNDVEYFGQVRFVRFNNVDMRVNMLQLGDAGGTHWHVGRNVTPFGTFPVRNLPELNPVYGYPVGYSYRSSLTTAQAPAGTAGILAARGTGGGGAGMALAGPAWYGTYALYNTPLGSSGKGKLSLGLSNGAQSSSENITANDAFGFIGHVSATPHPSWNLGASVSVAPYLARGATGLAAGETAEDFDQELYGIDIEYSRDRWRLMGEVLFNSWEVSRNAGVAGNELDATSWYLEARYAASPKFFLASRYSAIDFDEIDDGTGRATSWDFDVDRLEIGVGYRPTVNILAKLSGQHNDTEGTQDPDDDILVAQLIGLF